MHLYGQGVICSFIHNYSCTLNYEQNFFSISYFNEEMRKKLAR